MMRQRHLILSTLQTPPHIPSSLRMAAYTRTTSSTPFNKSWKLKVMTYTSITLSRSLWASTRNGFTS
eukprot:303383-Rhodomonas_salina.2